jgi:hypothetical protein
MFLMPVPKCKNGKKHLYWALAESFRTPKGSRHRIVGWLGELQGGAKAGWAELARQLGGKLPRVPQPTLFDPEPPGEPVPEHVEVQVRGVRVGPGKAFGDLWVGLVLWRSLELDTLFAKLLPPGREGVPWALIVTLDVLLPLKDAVERHLAERLGELFGLRPDLCLYDLTSAHFEGEAARNPLAQRGHSRNGRSDCKQVVLGLVAGSDGMPRGQEVFAGNRHDGPTLRGRVEHMEALYGPARRLWVIDRGRAERQLGRLFQRNSRAAGKFQVRLEDDPARPGHLRLTWAIDEAWSRRAAASEGAYLLRTCLAERDPEALWRGYLELTAIEDVFRTLKTDLVVRPIRHQTEPRVRAHFFVSYLALVLWKTLERMTKAAGMGDAVRRVLEESARIKLNEVILPTSAGREIRLLCVNRPDARQRALLDRLGIEIPERLGEPRWRKHIEF